MIACGPEGWASRRRKGWLGEIYTTLALRSMLASAIDIPYFRPSPMTLDNPLCEDRRPRQFVYNLHDS